MLQMIEDQRIDTVRQIAEPLLAGHAAELVELTIRRQGSGGSWLIRILADKVGGITIQDCARLNRLIGDALEQTNVFAERYTIEVSSPGLDRPFVSKRDYERAIGEQVEVHLVDSTPGRQQVDGMLLAVQEEAVVLTTKSGNITLPFSQIRTAKKAIHF